ncbi:MAG: hypothetical protein RLZZ293_141 [Pseudomonadota bacterium]|jgi:predicted helicase
MSAFHHLLQHYRDNALTKREQGNYFEKLVKLFLLNDERYSAQFTQVQTFNEWANENNYSGIDSGIDLVATNSPEYGEGFSAIQCKFYHHDTHISKPEIDSFISASERDCFTRRILVDTSLKGLNKLAQQTFEHLSKEKMRISLADFETSSIDWEYYLTTEQVKHFAKKSLLPHQQQALTATIQGFATADRGKLFMACGTGKTFTSLKIAEAVAGKNKRVLFLVPSLALASQTITEWSIQSATPIHAFAVCSDSDVGKRKSNDDDIAQLDLTDLAYPATTDPQKLAEKNQHQYPDKMTVIFSTYQSINVIHQAQSIYGMADFDLIICDEAHRTTGATLAGENDSEFVRVHDNFYIRSAKRLYMTATPKIYHENVKEEAKRKDAELFSMDDISTYGKVFYSLKFGEAVEQDLLTDYKVIVLAMDEQQVSRDMQKYLEESDGGLKVGDVAKMLGCYKALIKLDMNLTDKRPMQRAVAFCHSIIDSRDKFTKQFPEIVKAYLDQYPEQSDIICQLDHVDGTMNASEKNAKLAWLKEPTEDTCRILSNARCLSEGVDVPSLDAVMFIHGRKSKVDIVQSVGRVMRKAPDKQLGYIIIPIVIPTDANTQEQLEKNPNYNIVWDVLNALRSHDERLDAEINQVSLTDNLDHKIEAIKKHLEVIVVMDQLPQHNHQTANKSLNAGDKSAKHNDNTRETTSKEASTMQQQDELALGFDVVHKAIFAKVEEKCGTRFYWEDWATDVAAIANQHILRIQTSLANKDGSAYQHFSKFVNDLRANINDSVTEEEVIEMLAQHIITRPIFEALFSNYNFTEHNSISKSMQQVLDILDSHHIDNEAQKLDKFYESVKRRVAKIETAEAKQKIILELYDKFFRNAFPRMTERLGIVYTPVECVDFIIHSVNDILKQEFGQELGDKNTHIVDPFTGTGTFITRLMQSGLLTKDQLAYKYTVHEKTVHGEKIKTTELHANELVLLAYYIASINIESVYHAIVGGQYQSFEGICLTDTFQLNEQVEDLITPQLADNYHRRRAQKKLPIRVFIGNPPYSAGQTSGNDNNQNVKYPKLDQSIENSYVKYSNAGLSKSAYDSYIRAIRWASDRIDKYGVIGFITNAGWIESNSADGMRKCLQEEFSSLYIFHLRGNQRTSGELSRKEGGKIFGSGSRAPIAISILVKNSDAKHHGKIYFYDIGDYLTKEEKLAKIANLKSIKTISEQNLWQEITPDKYNDWLNQRDDGFYNYISMGDKKDKNSITIFETFTLGLATNRDAWVYNYSKTKLSQNVSNMIDFYNSELQRYQNSEAINNQPAKLADAEKYIAGFVNNDSTKISWTRGIRQIFSKYVYSSYESNKLIKALYRPFTLNWCYYNNEWNEMLLQMPKIFPEGGMDNLVIGVTGLGSTKDFSTLMSNILPDLEIISKSQQFPMYLYELITEHNGFNFNDDLEIVTAPSGKQYTRKHAITDAGLKHFTDFYRDTSITKDDLFYYIYGLLHSPQYKTKYADNLTKALPRIPCVKTFADFQAFAQAGRQLADLHLHYETADLYPVTFAKDISQLTTADFYVQKMKFASKTDKSKIIYNGKVTLENIPLETYDYIVNGKSAVEWVMERQGVATHKDSGIINDANDWAIETMNNPRYPLELLQSVITISLASVEIINNLPELRI